jgi:hypothetical protein
MPLLIFSFDLLLEHFIAFEISNSMWLAEPERTWPIDYLAQDDEFSLLS